MKEQFSSNYHLKVALIFLNFLLKIDVKNFKLTHKLKSRNKPKVKDQINLTLQNENSVIKKYRKLCTCVIRLSEAFVNNTHLYQYLDICNSLSNAAFKILHYIKVILKDINMSPYVMKKSLIIIK